IPRLPCTMPSAKSRRVKKSVQVVTPKHNRLLASAYSPQPGYSDLRMSTPITSPEIHYLPRPNGLLVVSFECMDTTGDYSVRSKGICTRMNVDHWQMIARRDNKPFAYFLLD